MALLAADWRLAARLARRELRGGLRGFGVFLACLWLGVAAIAGVASLSASMEAGLAKDGRTLLGGDIDLHLHHRTASPAQRGWLADRGSLSHVVGLRAMARTAGSKPLLVELKAVDEAYPLYGQVVLAPNQPLSTALARQEEGWGIAVEESVINRLGLGLGDWIALGEGRYRLTAVIAAEPDRAARGLVFGPTVFLSLQALEATGLLLPGSLVHHRYRLRLSGNRPIEDFRADLTARFPEAGWRITDTRQAVPRVSRFLERLTLFLPLIGLAALLVGGLPAP